MRHCAIAIIFICSAARADPSSEIEVGFNIGSFRLHGETMMAAGPELAAGFRIGRLALLADIEHHELIPDSATDYAHADRIGWRVRYDLPYYDERMGRNSDSNARMTVLFEAGTGEQFVSWDGAGARRGDLALGAGWMMSVHDRSNHRLRWGLYLALRATFASPAYATDPSATSERTLSPTTNPPQGVDQSYLFCFGYRL